MMGADNRDTCGIYMAHCGDMPDGDAGLNRMLG